MNKSIPDYLKYNILIVCEGVGDKNFLDKFILERNLPSNVGITHVNESATGKSGGREGLGSYLLAIKANRHFEKNIKKIIVISDNDDDMVTSFNSVCNQLKTASLAIPNTVNEYTKEKDGVSVAVVMIPVGKNGNMESMCMPAAHERWGLEKELDSWINNTPAVNWSFGKQCKVRLHALISVNNKKRPETGFAMHWNEKKPEMRISTKHKCFDDFGNVFLKLISP